MKFKGKKKAAYNKEWNEGVVKTDGEILDALIKTDILFTRQFLNQTPTNRVDLNQLLINYVTHVLNIWTNLNGQMAQFTDKHNANAYLKSTEQVVLSDLRRYKYAFEARNINTRVLDICKLKIMHEFKAEQIKSSDSEALPAEMKF